MVSPLQTRWGGSAGGASGLSVGSPIRLSVLRSMPAANSTWPRGIVSVCRIVRAAGSHSQYPTWSWKVRPRSYRVNVSAVGAAPDPGKRTKRAEVGERVVVLVSLGVYVLSAVVDALAASARGQRRKPRTAIDRQEQHRHATVERHQIRR
jgi:hypothetical protein